MVEMGALGPGPGAAESRLWENKRPSLVFARRFEISLICTLAGIS